MAAIFVSHSSRDNPLANEIKTWLQGQGYERVFLDFDKHTGLRAGEDWERQLYAELERSHAVVLILTPNWLDSKWCFVEFAQARALGKIIFPLVLAPLGDKSIAPEIQSIDLQEWNAEGQLHLAKRIRAVTDEVARGFAWDRTRSPYPGIHSFDQEDAAIYFGRDHEIREVIERLEARRIHGGKRALLVVGGSGSGKSSLLKAGVIPQLMRERRHWIVAPAFRPEHDPITNLAKSLAHCAGHPAAWRLWREGLVGPDAGHVITKIIDDMRVGDALHATLLIPIDQLEEAFTLAPAVERAAFLDLLQRVIGPQQPACQLVATVRSDILNDLLQSQEFSLPFESFLLGAIPIDRARKVIEGPANVAAIALEPGLSERICRDLSSAEALPLLAFMLREMYERFGASRRFTSRDYESLADPDARLRPIENAVRRRAEDVLKATRPDAAELDALKGAFIPHLVRARDDGIFVRQPARFSQLPAAARRLVDAFVDARLLTRRAEPEGSDETIIEVAHEALFNAWPGLRGWIQDEREFLAGKAQLARELADFNAVKPGERRLALLAGIRLRRAEQWLRTHPAGLSPTEVDFIQASRRETRRRRMMVATGALATAAVVVLAVLAARWLYAEYVQRTALECDRLAAELQNDVGLAGVEFDKIDTQRAIPACESALRTDPDNPRLMDELARSLDRAGRYAEAVTWYSKAAARGWAWSQDNLGVLYLEGRRDQDGRQVVPLDFPRGVDLLRSAAEQSNQQAIVNYAERDFRPIFEDSPIRVSIVETALVARGLLQRADATASWGPALDAALDAFKKSQRLSEQNVTLRVLDRLGVISELSHTIRTDR
jgi:tetratricopeptide (TPR) repeat protein